MKRFQDCYPTATLFSAPMLVALLLAFAPLDCPAQIPGTGEFIAETGQRLLAAPRVRILLASGEQLEGRLANITAEHFVLRDGRSVRFEQVTLVQALARQAGKSAVRNALRGSGAGLVATVLFAQSDRFWGDLATFVAGGLATGGAYGALTGSRRLAVDFTYSAPLPDADTRSAVTTQFWVRQRGPIRTTIAFTPFFGVARYDDRIVQTYATHGEISYGLSPTQELGLQLQYALGPRGVARLAGSAINARPSFRAEQIGDIDHTFLLYRGEVALELRMRSNVPGYFVVAADGIYNPEGYVLGLSLLDDGRIRYGPTGMDAGQILPRLGLGIGYDIFGPGDRRFRMEWIYRVGRYEPVGLRPGFRSVTKPRDWTFTLGIHLPLLRPPGAP